jgi:hypothetical protein
MTAQQIAYIGPDMLSKRDGKWVADVPGPALLAVVSDFCGHCTALKQTLTSMRNPPRAFLLTTDRNDAATQNLIRDLNIRGVPEIFSVDAGGKLAIYEGARDAKTIQSRFSAGGAISKCPWEQWHLPFLLAVIAVFVYVMYH